MPRIVYLSFPGATVQGGQKMILRHVEALRDLGFDATAWRPRDTVAPTWFAHRAPVEVATHFRPDDILVLPEDGPNAIAAAATSRQPRRAVIFCQNHLALAARGFDAVDSFPAERFPSFIAVGPTVARTLSRAYPQARVELVPCFVDERVFGWKGAKRRAVACIPRKRPQEALVIRKLLRKLHPAYAAIPWTEIDNASEAEVAAAMAASTLFLSLSRLEAVGMTPLEAMASGCLVAGFTGIGGRDFATPENGFWVDEDDCPAAADALAEAAEVQAAGGLPLAQRREAGHATAARWSYAAFRAALEEVWMRLAPEARLRDGPLD